MVINARLDITPACIETLLARRLSQGENGREARAGKERQRMTETNKTRALVATLRDALHRLDFFLEHTREDVAEVASQAERLREGVAALGDLRQREDTSVG